MADNKKYPVDLNILCTNKNMPPNSTNCDDVPDDDNTVLQNMFTTLNDILKTETLDVKDFKDAYLPHSLDETTNLIEYINKLTVKIFDYNLSESEAHEVKWDRLQIRTGRVFRVSKLKIGSCPCQHCQHSESPSKWWGEITIRTANHIVFDDDAERAVALTFFDDFQDDQSITLSNVSFRNTKLDNDWQELEYVTCNVALLDKLKEIQKHCSKLWEKVSRKDNYGVYIYNVTHQMLVKDVEQNFSDSYNETTAEKKGFFCNCLTMEIFSLILSFVSLLTAIAAIIFLLTYTNCDKLQSITGYPVAVKNKICLSCDDSSMVANLKEFNNFMENVAVKRTNVIQQSFTKSNTPSSAHIHLKSPPKIPGTEGDNDPNFTNKDHIDAHLQAVDSSDGQHARGIHVSETGIHISHSGLYYIYSSVNFKVNSTKPSSEFAYQTWFHYVHRTSPNSPMNSGVLLRSVYTACPSCNKTEESSFTGGVFNLQAGDKIQVCFSGQGFIDYDRSTSFFGLFMLTSPQDHHLDVGVAA